MAHIPTSQFDYRKLPPRDRLPAFRQMTASLYETWAQGDADSFQARANGYQVTDLIFTEIEFSAARFQRTPLHTQGGDRDFLTLHAQMAGTETLLMDHGVTQLRPGGIYLRDWAYPFDCKGTPMHMHTIVVPRHRLTSSVMLNRKQPILGWQMSEPEGSALFKLWSELIRSFASVTPVKAEVLCDAFLGFVDRLLLGLTREEAPATLQAMEQFLVARLRCKVGVEDLCQQFHASRATVYRLFEPHGGVRAYLSRMRLERAYADLRQADPNRTHIADIASCWGFDEPSSFSRKFRQQFDQCPSDVLGTDGACQDVSNPDPIQGADMYSLYMKWFNEASRLTPEPA
jgi:AraC-like DNA-binding protein